MKHRHKLFSILCSALLLALTSCAGANETTTNGVAPAASPAASPANAATVASDSGANVKAPPTDIVRASASRVELRAGEQAEASVRLEIAGGYHINANPPTHSYLIATQLDVAAQPGFKPGKPVYPPPLTKKFAFDPQPLAVYESEAIIKLPLRADASAAKGEQTLAAKVRVQPCDDQACYQPRTVEAPITIVVH